MLQLKDVTLLAMTKDDVQACLRALQISSEYIDFGDIVLMIPRSIKFPEKDCCTKIVHMQDHDGPFMREYIRWSLTEIVDHVETPYVLIVHPDGYVTNPSAWQPEFLNYDYIGAKWPWLPEGQNVGNSGFNLRSRRLLEAVARINVDRDPDTADDVFISRLMRPWLEFCGIKFAPPAVADRFSYEWEMPTQLTFGFHGFFNLGRENTDKEMLELLDMMPSYVTEKSEYTELCAAYAGIGNSRMVEELNRRKKNAVPATVEILS